jgi:Xaa-Pro aminopeptidase
MERRGLPLLLVTNLTNIFYLTGFWGSAGAALVGPSEVVVFVDPRYTFQAREEAVGVEVIEAKRGLLKAVAAWLRKRDARRVGYEATQLACAEFERLVSETRRRVKFESARGLIEELRAVKDEDEIAKIRRAGRLTVEVFEEVLDQVRPGVRESDLAAEIEYRMRKKGAQGAAFETTVASGPRGAFPHARASCKLLEKDELVIFDFGAIVCRYAADMTRTVSLGEPGRRVGSFYNAVAGAQQKAVEALREGRRAGDVDAAARSFLAARGVDRFFTHSTGHGVGLEIHEAPRLGRGEKARLQAGCVVAVEPGVYLQGLGGIRLEDTVLVGADGPEILTPAAKDHWVLT